MIVPHVDVEQHGSRDDEDEDEVVVNSQPAKVWCPELVPSLHMSLLSGTNARSTVTETATYDIYMSNG